MGVHKLTRLIIQIIFILSLGIASHAQTLHGVTDSLSGGGVIVPPLCAQAANAGNLNLALGCPLPMLGVI